MHVRSKTITEDIRWYKFHCNLENDDTETVS